MGVYFYEENINLDYFKWSSSPNSSWKANSVNWKMVLGVAAVGVGALMVGKVAYDAYQESKGEQTEKHEQNILSLGWEEGVGKKGSRRVKKEDFVKLGPKQVNNLPVYEPPVKDSSVSDFVSSFEYRKQHSLVCKDDIHGNTFSDLVENKSNQTNKADETETLDMEEVFVLREG